MAVRYYITEPTRKLHQQIGWWIYGNGRFYNRFSLYAPDRCLISGIRRRILRPYFHNQRYEFHPKYTRIMEDSYNLNDHDKGIKDGRYRILEELSIDNATFARMRKNMHEYTDIILKKTKTARKAEKDFREMLFMSKSARVLNVDIEQIEEPNLEDIK